jgi:hypothetical protein
MYDEPLFRLMPGLRAEMPITDKKPAAREASPILDAGHDSARMRLSRTNLATGQTLRQALQEVAEIAATALDVIVSQDVGVAGGATTTASLSRTGQAAIAGRLTAGSSLKGAMVSSVM